MLEKSESDKEESNVGFEIDIEDHLSKHRNNSKTEQNASNMNTGSDSSDNLNLLTIQNQLHQQFFKGKDGTMWQKAPA